uniref:Rhodanese domain-containing protein n=1 Tax=viral metagenome TaxID=1070528 RepID=A0A6C0IRK2_9ZZZZ
MGQTTSIQNINYEDIQTIIKTPEVFLLINTLPISEQQCLISNTLNASKEEELINEYLNANRNIRIVIYGKNCNDENVINKCNKLATMGFYNLYCYNGGLFEWLLLQDIYGTELFPTTKKEIDLLKYKPTSILNMRLLEY